MPGMTATVSVEVERRDDVVRVGSAALRFRPEGFEEGRGPEARARRADAEGPSPGREAGDRAEAPDGAGRPRGQGRRFREGAGTGARGDGNAHSAGTNGDRARGGRPGLVFVLGADGKPEPRRVRLGISDGQYVEVREGLDEGAPVITGIEGDAARASAGPRPGGSPTTNPFSPQRPQRRQR
jgi:multidrug efflux pump subunit AcrA (membrane-fusion protein)